ncbi:MAG: uroporphyrin-III C-methyltransferase/precorrin-2 dehydrogenase/sirohydrochlorin ferrochelatase [Paracoccaceae bacterium]|jgi:uroporphyrin-III C-methyltransferase/precorrin-2 dehydrogenase/sirohydrochlorin ferrochelatase
MDYLPIFLDIRNRRVIVDGGETVAARRVERALSAGAIVEVFNPVLTDEFRDLKTHENLTHFERPLNPADLPGALVAYGASDDPARDAILYKAAKENCVLANVADVTEYCDFITPSVVDRSPLVVAISSGGTAPVIARILRARIESLLPPAYGRLAEFVGHFRDQVSGKLKKTLDRRRFWEATLEGPVGDLFLAGAASSAEKHLLSELDAASRENPGKKIGEVYLVGAGPGDPDLLTFRALRLMQRADVVVYDRLVGDDILALMRRDAERIYVGKLPKQHTMQQEDISQLLVDLALEGKRVLRLKGGDPFIFGRGGEEIEKLAENDIPFQVVPGVTAAAGCASYSGIPLTHRDHAQSCTFVTAHGKDGVLGLDWDVLVRPKQTVAVYMGFSSLKYLVDGMVKHGVDPETPAAIIDNGTRENQRVVVGTVANLEAKAMAQDLKGPSIIIIGSVVTLHDKLAWFSKREEAHYRMTLQPQNTL